MRFSFAMKRNFGDKFKSSPEMEGGSLSKIKDMGCIAGFYGVLRLIFRRDYSLQNLDVLGQVAYLVV
jgi:hypothetical protein